MLRRIFKNKIVKASGWYTITNFFIKGLSILTIPIFTRLLSTGDYGIVSLYNSWLTIITIFVGLSLNESIRRAKYDYSNNYDEFISSITFLSILIFSGYLGLVLIFRNQIKNIIPFSLLLMLLMMFQSFFSYIKELAITKLRYEYNYKIVSIVSILSAIASVVLSIFLIKNIFEETPYMGRILGNALFVIIIGFIFMIKILTKGKKLVKLQYWKYALLLSTPLVFHSLSRVINNQFDRIIIYKHLGESITGIYSFAYNIGMIISIIYISIEQAWLPWFFEQMEFKKFNNIRSLARVYRDIFIAVYVVILMFSTEMVKILASESYWGGLNIIPIIFLAYFFQFYYSFEVNVEFALKKTKLISVGTILSSVINIILNLIFVPLFGYVAAAITTTISFFFLFVFHYLITARILKLKVYGFRFYIFPAIFVIISTIMFYFWKSNILLRILWVITTVVSVLVKHKKIATQSFR